MEFVFVDKIDTALEEALESEPATSKRRRQRPRQAREPIAAEAG
jgi:hypothetical protein